MTQVVTVHTDFTDLTQMTQGLVGRVNDSHVILPAKDPVEVGEWVQFAITLYDGSPAFAGVGRCVTFVDNGEDRLPHQRFDVVFDSLRFDSRAEQIYQHILSLSGIEVPAEAANDTGSASYVDVGDVSLASSMPAPPVSDDEGESTVVAGPEMREALSRSAVHSVDEGEDFGGVDPEHDDDDHSATNPPPAAAPGYTNGASGQLNGASFSYPGGLPFPSAPPRPPLDPSLRVTPAPRPS
jgi:hypothetical protein